MNDDFNKRLWEMAIDSPDLQQAIKKSMSTENKGYTIPTRRYSEVLEEVGDIHSYYLDMAKDEAQKEKLAQIIKSIDSMTIGELATQLNYVRVAMLVKEVENEKELTEVEKTLRDIDITLLALTVMRSAPKVIGRTRPLNHKKKE